MISPFSGNVDSPVASVLIHKAIGDRLHCVFVDTGLLRQGEAGQITSLFQQHYDIPLIAINAQKRFLDALHNVTDPKKKKKKRGSTPQGLANVLKTAITTTLLRITSKSLIKNQITSRPWAVGALYGPKRQTQQRFCGIRCSKHEAKFILPTDSEQW